MGAGIGLRQEITSAARVAMADQTMTPLPVPPPADPLPIVHAWLEAATREGVQPHPNAMTLATSTAAGRPSARMVLIKHLSLAQGFTIFYTHYGSRKALELEENPWAAGVVHWDHLGRQIRFEGPVVRSPEHESDAYFATRSWRSQLNAWSSEQSQPLAHPEDLMRRAAERATELGLPRLDSDAAGEGFSVQRPPFWGGYRLWFSAVELWVSGSDRFHDRVRYERPLEPVDDSSFEPGPWSGRRLQP